MRFTVGGKSFDLTKEQVVNAMKDVPADNVQKHIVEIDGQAFPPKQVFATVTGRERQTFTTMEAQRVLKRLGFACRLAGHLDGGVPTWVLTGGRSGQDATPDKDVRSLDDAVGTTQAGGAGVDTTNIRLPEDLAATAEVVARGRGMSVNGLVVDALSAEIARVKNDPDFMQKLRALTERDREILDRLAK